MSGTQPAIGEATPSDTSGVANATAFLVRQIMAGAAHATLVMVKSVTNAGGISPSGFVDVLPMVNQIDGVGNAQGHGVIHGLPYVRIQGGANAVIIDPQVGDIGVAVFADQDISAVKSTKAQANPGSRRRNDWADGVYLGGLLNGTPTQYVAFAAGGITIGTPNTVTIDAPHTVLTGDLAVAGDVTWNTATAATHASTHTHTQGADSHGDTESPTNAPTPGS